MIEIVFPVFCISCHRYPNDANAPERVGSGWVCKGCVEKIEMIATRLPSEIFLGLDGCVGVGYYHDPILRKALHALKYHSSTALLPSFEYILRRYSELRDQPFPWAGESHIVIQPLVGVPRRVRARGFDQSEFFAELIRNTWVPWAETSTLLTRRKKSVSRQADLEPGPLRTANVYGAYEIHPEYQSPLPHAVILVDDVVTTGATMKEAMRVLRNAGVRRVYGIAIAVGK